MTAHGPARKVRLESLLRREIATAVQQLAKDENLPLTTVTRTEMTGDLHQITAYYTVLGSPGQRGRVAHVLERARYRIQGAYAKVVRTRLLPLLAFAYDERGAQSSALEALIEQARATDPDGGSIPTPPAVDPAPEAPPVPGLRRLGRPTPDAAGP